MRTPADKKIVFVFHSHPTKDLKTRWQAAVEFPPGATAETTLPISIVDGEGAKVDSALFVFAGRELPVKDGAAKMTFAEFVAGKHSVPVWLHRKGMPPVPGVLTFA
ncbi:MAG: hypothetical protein IJ829_02180 [Kiritimatiellae bacterium]|nr:hypothetical protein [Kiritimatiellia bacterium]